MKNRQREGKISALMLLILAGAAFLLSFSLTARLDSEVGAPGREELMYFPKGVLLKELSVGHGPLIADLIWLRAIQYYGEHKLTDRNFKHLTHVFNVLTSLDPRFVAGYVFGSLVISQDAGEVESAILLLEKGIRANPNNWEILFETGFTNYVFLSDYKKAAEYFRLADRAPDCPEYVTRFAAYSSYKSGDIKFAMNLWAELMRNTKNPQMREIAEKNIKKLIMLRS